MRSQGLAYHRRAVTKENTAAALDCWKRALALDPASASLHAMIGYEHIIDARFGWWDDRGSALAKARSHADRALELDPENADANATSSWASLIECRYGDAAAGIRRAVQLAPGSADAAAFACAILAFAGHPGEAIAHGERAMMLSPNYPAYYLGVLGNAYRLSGRIEESIAAFKAFSVRSPGFGLADMVIAYQRIGRTEEARHAAEQLLSFRRDFTVAAWAKTQVRADEEGLAADIVALAAAGLPMS
jgi:adenylate cyclase